MSENPKKRHKKKSFLYKVSRALGARKRHKHRDEDSASSESNDGASCSDSRSASRSSNSRASPTKTPVHHDDKINSETAVIVSNLPTKMKSLEKIGNTCTDEKIVDSKGSDDKITIGKIGDLRLSSDKDTPKCQAGGSDRNLSSKEKFMQNVKPEIRKSEEKGEIVTTGDKSSKDLGKSEVNAAGEGLRIEEKHFDEKSQKSEDFEVISTKEIMEMISPSKPEIKATMKLIKKEIKSIDISSDSDESDTTESSVPDEIDSDFDAPNIKELYFTTGKFITYFFLEMERQHYNPNDEKYAYIHFRDTRKENLKKGEVSSSDSASPNISAQMKHKLLHRRSVDNLVITSPTSSLEHSSPESIKSAPIRLKPRSTSHDAIARKKDRYSCHTDGAASMDSLAKQALLAAQVLNLIPTQKARERNYLHGRIAANSLLGPVELEKVLPNREIKIFVGTWNMNGQSPPKELNDFMLPSEIQTIPDILAIGTQESCSERTEWEAAIQETLGPSHVLLTSTALGTLHLALFIRRDLIWFCSVPEEDSFSTRTGTAFRTKGAVALALILFGTSFLFVTAHLTAHQDKVKERVHDIKRIVRNLDLPKELPTKHKNKDVTQNFDCVFWCGDLNFRLAQPREEVIQWVSDTSFPNATPVNLAKDQLRTILNEGAVLRGFEEGPIKFPPTYKYDPGTQTFDSSSKQRIPAYTDRILFKGKGHTRGYIRRVSHESTNSHKDGNIECLVYDSVPSICTSDHKPVWGVFKTTVRPGIDTIPLAAGLFNREIYLEGIKRRAAAMDDTSGTSKVCSLQ